MAVKGNEEPSKLNQVFESIVLLNRLMRRVSFNYAWLVAPAILSFLAAFLDGASKGLIIPVINGIVKRDFSFISSTAIFKKIIAVCPYMDNSNKTILVVLVTLIFVISGAQVITSYLASVSMLYQTREFANSIRKAIFSKYMICGKQFFDNTSFGSLDNVLSNMTEAISNKLSYLHRTFTEFFRLIIYLIILFAISWQLTLFVLLIFPFMHYGLRWLFKKITRTSRDLVIVMDRINRKVFNVLSNIQLIKSYVREPQEIREYHELSDCRRKLEFSIDKKGTLVSPINNLFNLLQLALLLLAISIMLTINKARNIGDFVVYLYIIKNGSGCFGSINDLKSILATISAPTKEVMDVFEDENKFMIASGQKEFHGLKDSISIKNLNFSYIENKQILKNITFSIKAGEMTALIGPTGSGKTTIINLLMRFYECPSGTIFVDGTDIRDFSIKSLLPHIALVSQDISLFNATLRFNISYGMEGVSEERIVEALKKARLYNFVEQLPKGLETHIGDRGIQLSGGERQRLAIARALLKGSEILIMDEAMSSIDVITEKLIQEAIDEAIVGKTSIIIAHRFSTIKNAKKIVFLEHGSIAEDGSLEGLISKKGKFYQYWEGQRFLDK